MAKKIKTSSKNEDAEEESDLSSQCTVTESTQRSDPRVEDFIKRLLSKQSN